MRQLELHAHAKQIQRTSGRSSVAAAAYRSASKLIDERTGLTFDYTDKQHVEHTRVYVPQDAPEWAHHRASLWNAVEKKENRKNSCTAHEFEVSLPVEFNVMQRREAGDKLCRQLMHRYGGAVDIAYHAPSKSGDQRNYHAHIMFTTRGFDASTKDGWAKTKFRDLSKDTKDKNGKAYIDAEGNKTTRGKLEILSLREYTANALNAIAERDNLKVKVEHLAFNSKERTPELDLEKQPIQKIPQIHLGFAANAILKNGDTAHPRVERYLDIKRRNEIIERRNRRLEFVHRGRAQQLDVARQEWETLQRSIKQKGLWGLWRKLSGQRQAELTRIEDLEAENERLKASETAALELLEINKREQEKLKKSLRGAKAQADAHTASITAKQRAAANNDDKRDAGNETKRPRPQNTSKPRPQSTGKPRPKSTGKPRPDQSQGNDWDLDM